ncbi:protein EXORDIUM-like [Nymphaea colorata]|uniref:protein EXORDIUM-like n=1 Tax=Nymphaea colorata TaxID=210225 RepID=UPI00129DCB13|nr:protein EXORDIUM-like [Nymphaea colorata]
MASCYSALLAMAVLLCTAELSLSMGGGSRKLASLYTPPPLVLKYHNGPLLTGKLPLSIVWYGAFTPSQRAIVVDFISSLHQPTSAAPGHPTVSTWWRTVEKYPAAVPNSGSFAASVVPVLMGQTLDSACSLGKTLTRAQISQLASRHAPSAAGGRSLTLVLTSADVAVEGFCMGGCGTHGAHPPSAAYVWAGNSASQCPGTCAWPFHQPIYGPQSPPLVAPNGDVGMDGMVINVASLLAGAVTNPLGNGYYQGAPGAPLEAASACPGMYGKGSYPGYAGSLLVDPTTGASYNAVGLNGRKYLLPALWDPETSSCTTLV